MQEMQFWSPGRNNPLEKGMATHSSILAWEISWTEEPGGYSPWGRKESDMTERLNNNNWLKTQSHGWNDVVKSSKPSLERDAEKLQERSRPSWGLD